MFVLIISFTVVFWPMVAADSCSATGNVFDGPYCLCKYAKPAYKVIEKPLDWSNAFWDCQLQGMELVTIMSEGEENEIEKLLAPYKTEKGYAGGFWTSGATNGQGNSLGSFRWFTTGQLLKETYHKFSKGQPDWGDERCVHIYPTGKEWFWNNLPCSAPRAYVCQTRKSSCD